MCVYVYHNRDRDKANVIKIEQDNTIINGGRNITRCDHHSDGGRVHGLPD